MITRYRQAIPECDERHGRRPSKLVFKCYDFLRRITRGFAPRIYSSAPSENSNVGRRHSSLVVSTSRDKTSYAVLLALE